MGCIPKKINVGAGVGGGEAHDLAQGKPARPRGAMVWRGRGNVGCGVTRVSGALRPRSTGRLKYDAFFQIKGWWISLYNLVK
jgi:hypothetical protein